MKQPSFNVFQNRKSGEFVLSRQFEDEHGLHCDTGAFVRFHREQMKLDGCRFIEEHFEAFQTRKSNQPSEFQQMSAEEKNLFYKAHKNVWVYRLSQDDVVAWPMRVAKRGGVYLPVPLEPEASLRIPWPTSPDRFFDILIAALDSAH